MILLKSRHLFASLWWVFFRNSDSGGGDCSTSSTWCSPCMWVFMEMLKCIILLLGHDNSLLCTSWIFASPSVVAINSCKWQSTCTCSTYWQTWCCSGGGENGGNCMTCWVTKSDWKVWWDTLCNRLYTFIECSSLCCLTVGCEPLVQHCKI